MSEDHSLLRAMNALRRRLKGLEESLSPVDCVAQGKLEIALTAVEEAANLLGEDNGGVCLSCERPLRTVLAQPELDTCECDDAGAVPAWAETT